MEQLIRNYSLSEIAFFCIVLAAAVKGAITFFDWARERANKVYRKNYEKEEKVLQQEELIKEIQSLNTKVDMLIASDRDDIKAYLTEKHHFFCFEQGWIDDYSLEICERRYSHYVKEGGNSFIANFMKDLRELPKQSK